MKKRTGRPLVFLAASAMATTLMAQPAGDKARPIAPDPGEAAPLLVAVLTPARQAVGGPENLEPSQAPAPRIFVDYEFAYSGRAGDPGLVGAVSSHGFQLGRLLFYNELGSLTSGGRSAFMRGNSGVALDWPGSRMRLILGDVSSNATSDLGQGIRLGGISLKHGGAVKSEHVATPFRAFANETGVAGSVDVYVDGVHLYHAPVQPGRSTLRNVARFAGLRQVDVVVRDGAGREIRTMRSGYRADRMLAVGASEFEYALGAARLDEGESGSYGDLAFVASHRLGLTDRVTIGGHVDGIDSDLSASLGIGVRLDGYGLVSGELGVTREDAGTFAPAGSLRYRHVYRGLHITAGYKRAAPSYPPATGFARQIGLPAALIEDLGAKLSYSLETLGRITLASTRSSYLGLAPQVLTTLAYSYMQPRRWGLDCMVAYSSGAQMPPTSAEGWTAFVNLSLQFDEPAKTASGPSYTWPMRSIFAWQRSGFDRSGSGWDAGALSQRWPGVAAPPAGTWETSAGTFYGNVNPGDAMSEAPPTWQVGWSGSLIGANGVWARRRGP